MRILITGGHVTPAISVIKELRSRRISDILFIGRKFIYSSESETSYEYKEITKLGIPFYHLTSGRLSRELSLKSIIDLSKLSIGIIQSFILLFKTKPNTIMSFGGYLALPVCIVARMLGIKIYTHEQTISPGLANRIIGNIADEICISFPETEKYFSDRAHITGNPIRTEVTQVIKKPLSLQSTQPVIYVTGGSLGAHSINVHIEKILDTLLDQFVVIHQIGNVKKYNDYERLSKRKSTNYYPIKHVSSDEIGWIYKKADIVVSRSGANTIFELILLEKPAVLVPLPWSANQEQQKHADLLSKAGVAQIFDQEEESRILLEKIQRVYKNMRTSKENFKNVQDYIYKDAAKKIVDIIT